MLFHKAVEHFRTEMEISFPDIKFSKETCDSFLEVIEPLAVDLLATSKTSKSKSMSTMLDKIHLFGVDFGVFKKENHATKDVVIQHLTKMYLMAEIDTRSSAFNNLSTDQEQTTLSSTSVSSGQEHGKEHSGTRGTTGSSGTRVSSSGTTGTGSGSGSNTGSSASKAKKMSHRKMSLVDVEAALKKIQEEDEPADAKLKNNLNNLNFNNLSNLNLNKLNNLNFDNLSNGNIDMTSESGFHKDLTNKIKESMHMLTPLLGPMSGAVEEGVEEILNNPEISNAFYQFTMTLKNNYDSKSKTKDTDPNTDPTT